ncbi:MAG TPA: hypothetical protein VD905_12875, partial [Flavobacteriales bacterium]|nr:hypothetical protein [Flavobacteriales bacterium]
MNKLIFASLFFLAFLMMCPAAFAQQGKIKKSPTFEKKATKQPVKAEKATAADASKKMPEKTSVHSA